MYREAEGHMMLEQSRHGLWRVAGLTLAFVLVTGLLMAPAGADPGGNGSGNGPGVEEPGSRGQARGKHDGRGPNDSTTTTSLVEEPPPAATAPAVEPTVSTPAPAVSTTLPVVSTTAAAPVAPLAAAPATTIPTPPAEKTQVVLGIQLERDPAVATAADEPVVEGIRSQLRLDRHFDRAPVTAASEVEMRRGPTRLGWSAGLPVFAPRDVARRVDPGAAIRAVTAQPRLVTAVAVAIFGCLVGLLTFPKSSEALIVPGRFRRIRRLG